MLASLGTFTVLLMAPDRNGCTAPIIRMWPMYWIERWPWNGLKAQSNTGRCASLTCGAPSIVSCSSMYSMISAISVAE